MRAPASSALRLGARHHSGGLRAGGVAGARRGERPAAWNRSMLGGPCAPHLRYRCLQLRLLLCVRRLLPCIRVAHRPQAVRVRLQGRGAGAHRLCAGQAYQGLGGVGPGQYCSARPAMAVLRAVLDLEAKARSSARHALAR